MIRGILILLSFVALTLQQSSEPCTCQAGSQISDLASARYPISLDASVSLDITPDVTTIPSWASDGSVPTAVDLTSVRTFFSQLDTTTAQQKADAAATLNDTAQQRVDDLTAMQTKFQNQRALMQQQWDDFWSKVSELVSQKDDPKAAAQLLIDIFNILARMRYCGRMERWFTITLDTATDFAKLCSDRANALNGILDLSKAIDTTMGTCSCDRTAATAIVLATVPKAFSDAAAAMTTEATAYLGKVQGYLTTDAGIFKNTDASDTTDNSDGSSLFGVWANIENGNYPTYAQICTIIQAIVANRKAAFIQRITDCLQNGDWKVTSPDFQCTQDDSTGIFTCDFTGTMVSSTDGQTGVDHLVAFAKVVISGFTGCLWTEVKEVSYDSTSGAFDISITIRRNIINLFLDSLKSDLVKLKNKISDIVTTASADADAINAQATDDAATVSTNLDTAQQTLSDSATATATAASGVETDLSARDAAVAVYTDGQTADQAALQTSTSEWNVIFGRWDACTTKWTADKQACVSAYAKKLSQAEADLAQATANYLSCKLDYLQNPTDDDKKNFFINSEAALKADVEACCVTRDQIKTVKETLDTAVTNAQNNYASWKATLQTKCTNLDAGTKNTIAQIQADWKAKEADIAEQIKTAICGTYSTVRDVIVTFKNTDGTDGANYVQCTIELIEDIISGETDAEKKARHILVIKASVTMCGQADFDVQDASSASAKRQAPTGDTYTATAGTAPNPPPSPVSSGNTLVFSLLWAMVASLLVLF